MCVRMYIYVSIFYSDLGASMTTPKEIKVTLGNLLVLEFT